MSDFNWCHGPECHQRHTVDRVRGVKGSKVLRTRKIKVGGWNRNNAWSLFCSQGCYNDFFHKYVNEIVAIATTFTVKWFFMFPQVEGRS